MGAEIPIKSGEKFMCGYVCPCWREGAAENVTTEFKTLILWEIKAKRKKTHTTP